MDRPLIAPTVVMNAASTASIATSNITIIQRLPGISYEISWTGTTSGTINVQVSNSYSLGVNGAQANAGTWNTIPSSTFAGSYPAPAGSSGNGFIDLVGTEAYAARIQYVPVSGTGTMTITACAKVW